MTVDIHFWEIACFVIFVGLFIKPIISGINKALLSYRTEVEGKLNDATNLRIEAENFYKQYKNINRILTKKSKQILLNTEENIRILTEQTNEKIETQIAIRKKMHADKIAVTEAETLVRLKTEAINKAMRVTELYLQKNRLDKLTEKEIDNSINLIDSRYFSKS